MTEGGKRCVVAYATRDRQFLWTVNLRSEATIAEAIDAAKQHAGCRDVPWDTAAVGIFGRVRAREEIPADGDRIEIYRPLPEDPRAKRRERVAQQRRARAGLR